MRRSHATGTAGGIVIALLATACGGATSSTPPGPPAVVAPSGAAAVALSASAVRLTWTDNSANETGFEIERATSSGGPFALVATPSVNVTGYDDFGLGASGTYFYRVRAMKGADASAWASIASATTQGDPLAPPAAPSGVLAAELSASGIRVMWTDDSTDETGFMIERATSGAGPFAPVATVNVNVTGYDDLGLGSEGTFFYRVSATNGAGASPWSNTASATTQADPWNPPSEPSEAAATALSAAAIRVTWVDNSTTEEHFEIYRSTTFAGPFALIATVNVSVTEYDDVGLAASGTYFYRVHAANAAGASYSSATVSATTQAGAATAPGAPCGAAAAALSASAIRITWIDASVNETAFEIERAPSAGGTFVNVGTLPAGSTQLDSDGLAASTAYSFRVRATNGTGASAWSSTATATTQAPPATPPAAPSGAAATALSASAIRITWTDASANETAFEVERAPSAGGRFVNVGTLAAGSTQLDANGLAASTAYFFRVRATNAAGASAWSSTATATTEAPALAPPSAPSGTAASALSASAIRITWTDTSANESAFEIERASSASGTFAAVGTVPAGSTQLDSNGLAGSTAYFFRVRATNAAGASAWSSTATATTQVAPLQTMTLYPVADNYIATSYGDSTVANLPKPSAELIVGCNWLYNSYQSTQEGTCFGSAVKFDVSVLRNRTIEVATIGLYAYSPSGAATAYDVRALAGSWSTSTLTWNNAPGTYAAGGWQVSSPSTSGWLGWDVTGIVRNWASGAWVNNGLLFMDHYLDLPYTNSLRATSFYSSDYYAAGGRPSLVVQYR